MNPEDAAQNIISGLVGTLEISGVGHIKRAGQVIPMRQIPPDFAGVTPDDLRAALDAELPGRVQMFVDDVERILSRTVNELNAMVALHHGEFQSAANLVVERLIHTQRNKQP